MLARGLGGRQRRGVDHHPGVGSGMVGSIRDRSNRKEEKKKKIK
jgi:hypothetical protein